MEIKKLADGKYECRGVEFASEAGARLYLESRGPAEPEKNPKSLPLWLQTVIGLFSAYVVFSCVSGSGKSAPGDAGVSQSYALMVCQTALKRASIDPGSADIPYVDDQGGGSDFYFAWGSSTKPVKMKNGFGLMSSVGASCTVGKTSGEIKSLSLNSQTIK